MHHDHRRPRPRWEALAATVVLAAVAAPSAQAASSPKPTTWTKHVNRAVNAEQLGLPASASARSLGRMAIHRFAGELGLRGSLAGVRFALEQTPRGSKLRQLRFRQTVKGLRVLYSQIDVAVVEDRVSSISATVVPLMSRRLRGAKRVSAARARAIAERRIAGPDLALPAQPIAYSGTPGEPRPPRRAWVVQVTPAGQTNGHADSDPSLCVVIDAHTGKVLDVWEGVAARPDNARDAAASRAPAARAAQATEHNLFEIYDAKFVPGKIGSVSFNLATTGNPFNYGTDVEFFSAHSFPASAGILPDAGKLSIDMQVVPKHMCLTRGFCGRDGGFDDTFNAFFITVRAPGKTDPPTAGTGTRYVHSQRRVYVESGLAGSSDILAHELGHLMDHTYADDRITDTREGDEVEEALADMFAYDWDRNDVTLGESEAPGYIGSPDVHWANPESIKNPVEKVPYPSTMHDGPGGRGDYKCDATDVHHNSTILSHAYYRFVQKVGHPIAGDVLQYIPYYLSARPRFIDVQRGFAQRAEELHGDSVRAAAEAAFQEVGIPNQDPPGC